MTTEFLCIEQRSRRARHRWEVLSGVTGYDVMKLYREHSPDQGYFRLNHSVKKRYVLRMKDLCDDLGVDFYVSDADWKELSASGCCCGLKDDWNWSRGQFLTALLKAKDDGTVRWSDIEGDLDYADTFKWNRAHGFNTQNSERSAQFHDWSMKDWIRYVWNNVNSRKSPYKYFGGVLYPIDRDAEGDVVYEYRERQA